MFLLLVLLFDIAQSNPEVICHQPEIPENCHVVYENSGPSVPGSKVRYQCNAGFIRFGPEERICSDGGTWTNDVPVCAMNVARYRPVMLSGSAGNLSVDGDYHTCSTAAEQEQDHGWWDVDLLRPFEVYAVQVVYSPLSDEAEDRLRNLEIYISDSPVTASGKRVVCQKTNVELNPSEAHTFICAGKPTGTHVTLRTNQAQLLSLCEVMVLTKYSASYWQCGSMTGTVAWGAFGDSCYHSSMDAQPWFSASTSCQSHQGHLPEHVLASYWQCGSMTGTVAWGAFGDSCYHSSMDAQPWFSASTSCQSHQGHLPEHVLASYWQCGSMTGTVAWGAFGDSCYHSSMDAQPWFSASTSCQSHQGHLPEHVLASYWQCGSMTGTVAWGAFGDSCYHSSMDAQPWFSASTSCQSHQGHLPEHVTFAQHRYMMSELSYRAGRGFPGYWLGLVSDAVGRWVYPSDGMSAKDTFWFQPTDALPASLQRGVSYASLMTRDAEWSWTPQSQQTWNYWICKAEVLYCGSPGIPEDGGVILSSQTYNPGIEAYYYCRNGFVVTGAETRKCLNNGTWSGRAPTCTPVVCNGLPRLTNGLAMRMNESSVLGSTVQFECRHGYKLVGPYSRTCLSTGLWSGPDPSCLEINCKVPDEVQNGHFHYINPNEPTRLDSQIEYKCNEGYKLIGDAVRTCLEEGTWVPRSPVCVDVKTLKEAIGDDKKKETWSFALEGAKQSEENHNPSKEKEGGLSNHATNLIASFIAVVVVMIVAISIIVLWVWKRRKTNDGTVPSTSVSGRSSADGAPASFSSREILYAFTNAQKGVAQKPECLYQVSSDLTGNNYDMPPISVIGDGNIYASPESTPSSEAPLVNGQPLYYSTIKPEALSSANPQKLVLLLTDEEVLKRLQNLPLSATLPKNLAAKMSTATRQMSEADGASSSGLRPMPFLTIRDKSSQSRSQANRSLANVKNWVGTLNSRKVMPMAQFDSPPSRPSPIGDSYKSRKDIARPKIPPPPVPGEQSISISYVNHTSHANAPSERSGTPDSQLFNFSDASDDEDVPPVPADPPPPLELNGQDTYDLPPGETGFYKQGSVIIDNIYEELQKGPPLSLPAHLSKAHIETDYTVC